MSQRKTPRDLSGVEEPTQFELMRDVADHEVLYIFTNDDDAAEFRTWMDLQGWELFANWDGGR
jgi:hypothetical protein